MTLEPVASPEGADPELLWFGIASLEVEGCRWAETAAPFDRLPARAEGVVPEPVWELSRHSAGVCARFLTDTAALSASWTVGSETLALPHMPASGVSGLDLYVRDGSAWRFVAIGRPDACPTNHARLIGQAPDGLHEFTPYLPLYNSTVCAFIGVPPCARIEPAQPRARLRPICFYGTSITQGGCASRSGMAYPALIGRWLDTPTINLGFSGNGRMQPEVIELLAELDPSAFVLDCIPNMSAADVTERSGASVCRLREARPETPVLLVESLRYTSDWIPATRSAYVDGNRALREAYDALPARVREGVVDVPADDLIGDDHEGTVDSGHPTDLGFMRMATALGAVLEATLAADQPRKTKQSTWEGYAPGSRLSGTWPCD